MALGSISFGQGIASGLDFRAIVDVIIKAESVPINKLQSRIDTFTKAKNAFGEIDSLLKAFQTSLEQLKSGSTFGGKTTTLDVSDAPFTVSASPNAAVGSYEIEVTDIAQAERRRSAAFSDKDSPLVADGTITLQSGTHEAITIEVSAAGGNNSLQAIADAINGADQGVRASIVNNGTGSILVVKSEESGTANALTVSDSTNLDLDLGANVLQAAHNASVTVDGVAVTSQDNSVSGAIAGVTLNLTGTTDGAVNLTIGEDVDGSKESLSGFVAAYNKINDFFVKNFGSATEQSGSAIAGSSTARNLQRQIQSLVTGSMTGIGAGSLSTLAELGITVADRTGRLEFDAERFDDLVEQGRFDEVRSVLLSSGSTTDSATRYVASSADTQAGSYAVTVSVAGERGDVGGSTAIVAGGLSQAENLTVTIGSTDVTVALNAGDTISAVVTKLNTAFDNAGFGATAYSDGGRLRLRTDDYGALQSITAVSDVADAADGRSTGIGTAELTDAGVDIVGTIGGVAATGQGNELIGAEGSDAAGLVVRVYATAASVAAKAGNFGSVGFSQGAADRFIEAIDGITDPLEGTIKSMRDSYQASIDAGKTRIEAMQARLALREETLIRQFSAAEQAISQLKAFQSSLQGLR